jgi:erythromycin esterase-like protein
MVHTLENLMEFHGADAKAIIWEHNTHIGDARATDM